MDVKDWAGVRDRFVTVLAVDGQFVPALLLIRSLWIRKAISDSVCSGISIIAIVSHVAVSSKPHHQTQNQQQQQSRPAITPTTL
jgi:hypothetical protein